MERTYEYNVPFTDAKGRTITIKIPPQSQQPKLVCPECPAEYSGTGGDYFFLQHSHVMVCDGGEAVGGDFGHEEAPMALVFTAYKVVEFKSGRAILIPFREVYSEAATVGEMHALEALLRSHQTRN